MPIATEAIIDNAAFAAENALPKALPTPLFKNEVTAEITLLAFISRDSI